MDTILHTIITGAVTAMDQAREFEKRFPQSAHLGEVRRTLKETLSSDFGSLGFPAPQGRALDVVTTTRKFLVDSPDDVQLHLVLFRTAGSLPKTQQFALYEELSNVPTPEPARSLAKEALRKLSRVGIPLDLSFNAVDGRPVSLLGLRGKVVLIDFWSTDCAPCVRELPTLKRLYSQYQAQGLEIVGISLDTDKEKLRQFLQTKEIPWPQYYDAAGPTNRLAQEYGILSIPAAWLIDRQGRLRHLDAGNHPQEKIEALLQEP